MFGFVFFEVLRRGCRQFEKPQEPSTDEWQSHGKTAKTISDEAMS
jgi:hypothetical protein